ncbi:MAG: MFS transporter [Myxococcales bacterium]|nr:MFS transporter [Myxococcales bacterium]
MTEASPAASERRGEELRVLVALWLLVLASSSQVLIVAPILPRIGEALAIPEALRGTLITSYTVAQAIFALIIGPISDRAGRRPVLLAGAGAMLVALLLHALPGDYASMITVRALAGAAGGLLTGVAVAYIGDYFPYNRRGWASGWVMSGFAFGQVLAIPAGTILAAAFGFRAPFLLFALPMAASFVLILVGVPQPSVRREGGAGGVGAALRTYAAMLRTPAIAAAALTFGLMFMAMATFAVYLPTWLENQRGATPKEIAAMFMVGGVASVFAGPQMGRISDRIGRKPMIVASCLGMAALVPALPWLITEVWIAYPAFFAAMILLAMRLSPMQALLTALTPSSRRGSLLSLTVACGQLGSGAGGAAAGLLFARYGYEANTLMTAAAMVIAALIVALALPEPGSEGPAV